MRKLIIIALLLCACLAMGQDFFRRRTPVAVAGGAPAYTGPDYWWKFTAADGVSLRNWNPATASSSGIVDGVVLTNYGGIVAGLFSGDDRVEITNLTSIVGMNVTNFSVEYWEWRDQDSSATAIWYGRKYTPFVWDYPGWHTGQGGPDRRTVVGLGDTNTITSYQVTTPEINLSNWTYIAFTVTDTNVCIYYNSTQVYNAGLTVPPDIFAESRLWLGDFPELASEEWIGMLDSVGIWTNRVLTPAEVAASVIYNGGTRPSE